MLVFYNYVVEICAVSLSNGMLSCFKFNGDNICLRGVFLTIDFAGRGGVKYKRNCSCLCHCKAYRRRAFNLQALCQLLAVVLYRALALRKIAVYGEERG